MRKGIDGGAEGQNGSTVSLIHLDGNDISDEGAEAMAEALKVLFFFYSSQSTTRRGSVREVPYTIPVQGATSGSFSFLSSWGEGGHGD